jgi:hypothetical protein
MSVTRYHEFEIYSQSDAGLIGLAVSFDVTVSLSVHDSEVCVDEITEITLAISNKMFGRLAIGAGPHSLSIDIDPTEGLGAALCSHFEHELESIYADDWQKIAIEDREGLVEMLADEQYASRKEDRDAR